MRSKLDPFYLNTHKGTNVCCCLVVFYQNVFTPIQPPVIKRPFSTNQSIPMQTDSHWLPWKYGARSCLHFDITKMQQNTLVIPFIPNLLRLLYLLMRTKITMRKTQPKPARPTAIDIYRKKSSKADNWI